LDFEKGYLLGGFKMKRLTIITLILLLSFVLFGGSVLAQESAPQTVSGLLVMTDYPAQAASAGDTITLKLNLETGDQPQVVDLELNNLPDEWQAVFRGQNKVVQSVFVDPNHEGTVDLRIDIPANASSGEYIFDVVARGETQTSRLPITFMVEEKGPAQLNLDVALPTIRSKPDSTFRFNGTLKNEGDADLTVDLAAELPDSFNAVFKSGGQEITSIPVTAGGSESITIEVDPLLGDLTPSGQYPIQVTATGDDLQAEAQLIAEVVGESRLTFTTPDSRLSGDIPAGETTALSLVLVNTGSAPARNIDLSATQPSGWTVTFDPESVPEVAPGGQAEVTANIQPNDKALSGDYMLTFRARPEDSTSKSIEYRATVQTSTLWGVVGVAMIAVAVLALGLAVARFGRR
jgi:uncharacterized membrane protein